MYRSQLLLQQLGISQWVPKLTEIVTQPAALLWRDQDEAPIVHTLVPKVVVSDVQTPVSNIPPQSLRESVANQQSTHVSQTDEISNLEKTVEDSAVDIIEAPKTIAFNCHMLVHENFVLFAEINTEHQQKLFNRIAEACHVSGQRLLQWPLAIEFWDVNDVVLDAYLQGVFAQHRQKVCVLLGEVALPNPKSYFKQQIICANLEQLLESTQQKRALWQQLYPLVYDVENHNAQEGRDI